MSQNCTLRPRISISIQSCGLLLHICSLLIHASYLMQAPVAMLDRDYVIMVSGMSNNSVTVRDELMSG